MKIYLTLISTSFILISCQSTPVKVKKIQETTSSYSSENAVLEAQALADSASNFKEVIKAHEKESKDTVNAMTFLYGLTLNTEIKAREDFTPLVKFIVSNNTNINLISIKVKMYQTKGSFSSLKKIQGSEQSFICPGLFKSKSISEFTKHLNFNMGNPTTFVIEAIVTEKGKMFILDISDLLPESNKKN